MAAEKTALVLSAGGMFGAYQAGAWKALEKAMRPDIVVGASAGALNGWMIAGGCTGEELSQRWLDAAAADVLSKWFRPEPLRRQTEKMVAEVCPKIPFGLVMLELPRFRAVLVECPDVTAAHLQATCAVPLALPWVTIGGRRYVDGGVIEKLPIWAAVRMGATKIIAVDALPEFDTWWWRTGVRIVQRVAPRRVLPAGLEITLIRPSERMGRPRDLLRWNPENAARWIALGERDAKNCYRART